MSALLPRTKLATAKDSNTNLSRRRRRLPIRLFFLFFVLALIVWFAPVIVAHTPLRNRVIHAATASLNGTITVGSARLGWLAPVELRDITLSDAEGRVLARIPKVTTTNSLFSLAKRNCSAIDVTIEKPTIEVICTESGSNLEDVLQKYLAPSEQDEPSKPTRTRITVRVIDGKLTLNDSFTNLSSEFWDLQATVSIPATAAEPITAKIQANAPERVALDTVLGETGRVEFKTAGLQLESLTPLVRRIKPGLSLAGSLSSDLVATWGSDTADVNGLVGIRDFAMTGKALQGETLELVWVSAPIKASATRGRIQIDQAELTTDIGTVSLTGIFDPEESLNQLMDRPGLKFNASVDVAKLATLLPRLLRVRDDTEFREGNVVVKLASTPGVNGTAWAGSVNTSALKAVRDGREILWDEPLKVDFVARAKAGELLTIDKLTCQSDFMALNARMAPDSVRAAANIYLDRLATRLNDFIDLGEVKLEGEGSAWLVATRAPDGDFKADAGLDLKKLAFANASGKGLREATVKLQAAATGKAMATGHVSIATGSLVMTSAGDEAKFTLLEGIADVRNPVVSKLDARIAGDLGRWHKRLSVLTSALDGYLLSGNTTARGTLRLEPDQIIVDQLTMRIDNARFVGAGLDIDEPRMDAVTDLTIDRKAGIATCNNFTVTSAPLSVERGKLVIEAPAGGSTVVHGGGPAITDLNRLGKTVGAFGDPRGASAWHGRGVGPIQFRYAGDVTTFGGNLDVAGFALGTKAAPVWQEANLRIECDGSFTRSADTVTFKSAKLSRPGFAVEGSGSIGKFATTTDVNVSGQVNYDWAKLSAELREAIGPNVVFTGKGAKPFHFIASLTPPPKPGSKILPSPFANATGELAIGWDAATAYGFETGAAELRVKLANGVARVAPVSASFGGGKVTVEPAVQLDPGPAVATFKPGVIVDRAKLTPTITAGMLGFALPPIANSTKAEGEISLRLDESRVPLADAKSSTVKGELLLHSATLTPGPVLTEVARLLGAENATMTLAKEQSVPVSVENGRVHHNGLAIKIGAYNVITSGSAGFDGTLDMIADVPIPGGLPFLKDKPALDKALTGKRIRVPIRGTMAVPRLDRQAFNTEMTRLTAEASREVGQDLLKKELDKVIPGGLPTPAPGSGGTIKDIGIELLKKELDKRLSGGDKPGGLLPFPLPRLKKQE